MRNKLKTLEDLQAVDVQILELNKSGESHPKRLAELEAGLAQARAAVDQERARLADNERQRSELEQRHNEEKDKVRKWEARLSEQRTTREYSSLAREIDIAKKVNANVQEEILLAMQQGEEIEKALAARQAEYKAKEAAVLAEMKELRAKIDSIRSRVKELSVKRAAAAKEVDAQILRRYDAIRAKRGIALVPADKGTCQGCHISLPPQLYNTIVNMKTLETCPNCNRILYVREG